MARKGGIFDAIRGLFGRRRRDDAPAPAAEARPAAQAVPAAAQAVAQERFASFLHELLANRASVAAGRLQMMSLDKIRARLGQQWPRYAERVHALVAEVLHKRLLPTDVYTRMGESAYAIVFSTLAKAEAQVKCALIAEEIATRLFGRDDAAEAVEVRTVAVEVGRGVVLEKVDVMEVLNNLFDKEAVREGRTTAAEDAAAAAAAAAAETAAETDARLLEWLKNPFDPVVIELPGDLDYRFRPIWDTGRNALSTFLCVIVRKTENPDVSLDYSSLYLADSKELIAKLDYHALARIKRELKALHLSRRRVLLACPVHFLTLNRHHTRVYYLSLLKDVPAGFGQYLVFEIVGLPDSTPQGRVAEIVAALKPHGRTVLARLGRHPAGLGHLARTGLHAVGIDAAQYAIPEARMMAAMNEFVALAKEAGLKTYIHGLPSLSLTTAALGAGFDYIHSNAVQPPLPAPDFARRFEFMDLYAKRLAGGR